MRFSFFCELDGPAFEALAVRTASTLAAQRARVTMALKDCSPERARGVRALTALGVEVGAWLLVPHAQGYFATPENLPALEARYAEVVAWARDEGLSFASVGLDFEPDAAQLERFFQRPVRQVWRWVRQGRDLAALQRASAGYQALLRRIEADGYRSEAYLFPLVLEDRRAGGRGWQSHLGLLDVRAQREVVMLYSSLMGPFGAGLVAAWAPHARAVGLGSTGGGIDPWPKLSWEALARDVATARASCDDVTLFSLEGCEARGWLERLPSLGEGATPVGPLQRLPGAATRQLTHWLARLH